MEELADKTWTKIIQKLDKESADEAYAELLDALRIARVISDFRCSEHGIVKAVPACSKCLAPHSDL